MVIAPGSEIWSTVTPLTQAASPLVTPWISTDGYLKLVLAYVFTTGTTAMTVEGSGDAITQDTTRPYAAVGASPATVAVMHRFVRFRLVQTVADATVTSVFVKSSN
jgi:hypothetical protein